MFFFIYSIFCENIFRISSFNDKSIKLIHNTKGELKTSFIHAHDNPKFYYKIKELSPGYIKIINYENELALESDNLKKSLYFKKDMNSKNQSFQLKLTPEGGYRIFQNGKCLTLKNNSEITIESCGTCENQVFMLILAENNAIIQPISQLTYVFNYEIQPTSHG